MEIYILNKNFKRAGILDTYISFMWCERYNQESEFDLEVEATKRNFDLLKYGN